ncbi:MAG: hypothetical protein NUW37_08900 [Planctomycetes bacterium]|nr:hypothetical protein [Planctomycetota bacterium]
MDKNSYRNFTTLLGGIGFICVCVALSLFIVSPGGTGLGIVLLIVGLLLSALVLLGGGGRKAER